MRRNNDFKQERKKRRVSIPGVEFGLAGRCLKTAENRWLQNAENQQLTRSCCRSRIVITVETKLKNAITWGNAGKRTLVKGADTGCCKPNHLLLPIPNLIFNVKPNIHPQLHCYGFDPKLNRFAVLTVCNSKMLTHQQQTSGKSHQRPPGVRLGQPHVTPRGTGWERGDGSSWHLGFDVCTQKRINILLETISTFKHK